MAASKMIPITGSIQVESRSAPFQKCEVEIRGPKVLPLILYSKLIKLASTKKYLSETINKVLSILRPLFLDFLPCELCSLDLIIPFH